MKCTCCSFELAFWLTGWLVGTIRQSISSSYTDSRMLNVNQIYIEICASIICSCSVCSFGGAQLGKKIYIYTRLTTGKDIHRIGIILTKYILLPFSKFHFGFRNHQKSNKSLFVLSIIIPLPLPLLLPLSTEITETADQFRFHPSLYSTFFLYNRTLRLRITHERSLASLHLQYYNMEPYYDVLGPSLYEVMCMKGVFCALYRWGERVTLCLAILCN